MMKDAISFACVGDNCVDRIGPPVNQALIGGNAVNAAVQLAGLGARSAYYGVVGDDDLGQSVLDALETNGVDITHAVRGTGKNAVTDIRVGPDGDRMIAYEDFGPCATYHPLRGDLDDILRADHTHIGWLADQGDLLRALVTAGRSVSRDVSINADPVNLGVDGCSIAFASEDGGRDQAMERACQLLAGGAKLAVVTRGAHGSLAFDGTGLAECPAEPVTVLDTTGAGDSFIAGFLYARLNQQALLSCLQLGARTAARTCTHSGGFPQ